MILKPSRESTGVVHKPTNIPFPSQENVHVFQVFHCIEESENNISLGNFQTDQITTCQIIRKPSPTWSTKWEKHLEKD